MKTLDLNAYGVEEMSMNEMKKVNGGFAWLIVAVAAVFALVDYWQDGKIDGKIYF
jgi:bacteriocin-like protein